MSGLAGGSHWSLGRVWRQMGPLVVMGGVGSTRPLHPRPRCPQSWLPASEDFTQQLWHP